MAIITEYIPYSEFLRIQNEDVPLDEPVLTYPTLEDLELVHGQVKFIVVKTENFNLISEN